MPGIFGNIFKVNWIRTVIFNFKYFRFRDAARFPVLLFGRFDIHALKGEVILKGPVTKGRVRIGAVTVGIFEKRSSTVLNIYGTLQFDGPANIGGGSSISIGKGATLRLGANFKVTAKSSIVATGAKSVEFGADCLLSWDILVMNTDFHKIMDKTSGEVINPPQDVKIGNKVWIGCQVTILKGAVITDNAVIAAGSVVSGTLDQEHSIYAGLPAKKIRNDIYWKG